MWKLLSVKPIDVTLIVLLSATVVGIAVRLIMKKKKGINGCGCGCNGCPHANACPSSSKEKNESEQNEEI